MSTLSDGGGRGFFVTRKHGRSRGAAAHLRCRRLFFEPLEQRALLDGLGVIAGTVFDDLDRDGICDLGEPGLAGWTVELQPAGGATGLVQTLLNPASGDSDLYGRGVAVADGKILVGAPGHDTGASDAGVAYLFDASGGLLRTFENPEPAAGDQFGSAVAMVGGNVLVGCPYDDAVLRDAGAAYLFEGATGTLLHTFRNPAPFPDARFGSSVTAYGNNVLIGCPRDSTAGFRVGAAYLFDGSTGDLLQRFLNPVPASGDQFGSSLAVLGGNILIGAKADDTGAIDAGAAYLFDPSGALLHTFENPAPAAGDQFGSSLAALGNHVLVGAPSDDTMAADAGAVYLFDASGGDLLHTFVSPAPAAGDQFGSSLTVLDNDVLVGAPYDDTGAANAGAAYLFQGATGTLLQVFANPAPAGGDGFGSALAALGRQAVIAAPNHPAGGGGAGAVYLFDGFPEPVTILTNGEGAYSFDGLQPGTYVVREVPAPGYNLTAPAGDGTYTIAIAGDETLSGLDFGNTEYFSPKARPDSFTMDVGRTLSVPAGGVLENDRHAAGHPLSAALVGDSSHGTLTFRADGSFTYTPQPTFQGTDTFTYVANDGEEDSNAATVTITVGPRFQIVSPSDTTGDDEFGDAVAIDGRFAIVGAPDQDSITYSSGAVYVYEQGPGGTWTQVTKLIASDASENDYFGGGVDITGDWAIVGAPFTSDKGNYSGSAYIFHRHASGSWSEVTKLLASDGHADDSFGANVLLDGEYAIVAASGDDDGAGNSGSVYVFRRDLDGNWNELTKLHAPDPTTGAYFGGAMAIDGDLLVLGALGDNTKAEKSGAAYVFRRTGDTWTAVAKLTASDGAERDQFGRAVDVYGDYVIVGASYDDEGGLDNSGAAYVFRQTGGSWAEVAKLTASDPGWWDFFGSSVQIAADYAIVGADYDHDLGDYAGSAYLFQRQADGTWDQIEKLLPQGAQPAGSHFAVSVALDDNLQAVIGAPGQTIAGIISGAAYFFNLIGNDPPLAEAGGPYKVAASSTVQLDGAGSTDANQPGTTLTFQWDLDADGIFGETGAAAQRGDEVGIRPTFAPVGLAALQIVSVGLRVTDLAGATAQDTAAVNIMIQGLGEPPVAVDDAYQVDFNHALTEPASGGVLANDLDADGDPLTAAVIRGPSAGVLEFLPDGSFTYIPRADYQGIDSFTYRAFDGDAISFPATVTITVRAPGGSPNHVPVAEAGGPYLVLEGWRTSLDASGSSDPDQAASTLTYLWDLDGDGLFGETGAEAAYGDEIGIAPTFSAATLTAPDSITVTLRVVDDAGMRQEDTATVNVRANQAPVAGNDRYQVYNYTTLTVRTPDGVLANDSDPDGDPLSVSLLSGPTAGSLTLQADGSFVYTPHLGFVGPDSFTYLASDGPLGSNVATVTIQVSPLVPSAFVGRVYEDPDRDGVEDPGESALEGWTIDLRPLGGTTGLVQVLPNPTPGQGDLFGGAVAIFGDGLLVGAPRDDTGAGDAGAAYLFDASGALMRTFQKPTPAGGDLFGASVAVIGDKVLIGCPNDDTVLINAGAAYLFDAATGTLLQTFLNPAPFPGAHFGASVSAVAGNVLVGCPEATAGTVKVGAAYLFDITTGGLLRAFPNPTPATGDQFGSFLAAIGNNVLIAAAGDDTGATDAGAVYLFDGGSGNLLRTFLNPTPVEGDRFGSSLAAAGGRILVGAPEDDTGADNAGAAYLFDAQTGGLLQTFLNPSPQDGDRFAGSLVLLGNTALIGAAGDDTGANDAGAAYLYYAPTGELLQTLLNPAPADGDRFGAAVALAGGRLFVAAENDDTFVQESGAVYGYVSSAISRSTVTNASGDYHFDGLRPGWYVLSEHVQAGYFQSLPQGDGSYTIFLDPDTLVFDVDFANYQNDVPVAHDDGYGLDEDHTLVVQAPGVLGNDVDLDELTASLLSTASHGTLTLSPDGSFEYTPQPDFHGIDSFTYKAGDGLADSNVATVTITVRPINDVPLAADDLYRVEVDATLTVPAAGVLANDTDVDGDVLSAILADDVSHGSLTLQSDGAFTYVPATGFRGTDRFTYRASDGTADSEPAEVTIVVGPGSLGGTVFDDLNRDRVWGPGEPGLQGWEVHLDSTRQTGDLLTTIQQTPPTADHRLGQVIGVAGDDFLVSSPNFGNYGGVVYLVDGSDGKILQAFSNPAPQYEDDFGDAVAAFGDDVFIAAPRRKYYDDTPCGVVYRFDASTGELLATYVNPRPVSGNFGRSIAVTGNRVVIGAETTAGGVAHVFDASTMELLRTVESPNPQPYASFGKSVAAVGDDFLISAPGEDRGEQQAGAAYLFDGSTWELLHTFYEPTPTEDGNFGAAVAVAGATIAFGVPHNDTGAVNSGVVYLFDASSGALLHTLVNPQPQIADGFGSAVAWLGNDLLVGTPFLAQGDITFPGEAHLFDGSTWQLRHTFLNPTPGARDRFGQAVAAAGNKVLIGSPFDDTGATDAGAAYLFVGFPRSFTTLTDAEGDYTFTQLEPGPYRLSQVIQADYYQFLPGGEGSYSVTLAPDDVLFHLDFGNLVNRAPQAADNGYDVVENTTLTVTPALGVLKNDSDPDGDPFSAVLVQPAAHGTLTFQTDGSFTYTALTGFYGVDRFTYKATDGMFPSEAATVTITVRPGPELLMASDKADLDAFGYAVAIDGDYIAVGAYCDDTASYNDGSVYVYQRQRQGNWIEVAHLTASDRSEQAHFGISLAIDGDRMLIGATRAGYEEGGAAYVFERQADGRWAEVAKLLGDRDPWTQFGMSVALRGDRIVVGANAENGGKGYLSGTAYVFERTGGGTWNRVAKLIASDGTHDALFGRSVAIDGDYLVVGAMYDPDPVYQAGSAYVFHRSPSGQWTQVAKLNASDGAMYDYFGLSVAIDGDTVVVGAHGDDDAGDNSGAAYVFQRQPGGMTFSQVAKLAPAQPFMDNLFGRSVAIYGDYILVGAAGSGGSTYVFHREGAGQWQEIARFRPNVPGGGDQGHPVAISATLQAVAGVPLAYLGGVRTGAAYVFNVIGNEPPFADAGGPYVVVQGLSVPLDASGTVDLDQPNTTLDYRWDLDGDGVFGETGADARYGDEIGISPVFSAAAIDRPGSMVVGLRVTDALGIAHQDTATVTINPPPQSLGGYVYQDLNRNGVRDPGEPGLAGWNVQIERVDVGEVAATLSVSSPRNEARFGEALATLGEHLLVGAPGAYAGDSHAGAAYLFDLAGNLLQTFVNPTPNDPDYFGQSIAVLGDKVAIGCPEADEGATGAGAVYLFDPATGELLRTFQNPTPGVVEEFGWSVAAVGDNLLVGCPSSDDSGPDNGAAYLFNGTTGNLLHTFLNPMAGYYDDFGHSVAALGDDVLVGNPDNTVAGKDDAGAVYLYDGATGALRRVFENPTPAYTDYFGWAIAAVGNDVLISARNDDTLGMNTGIVYLFDSETGDLLHTFYNPSPKEGDLFGSSLAVLGNRLFVGARQAGGNASGAVYMFDLTTGNLLHSFLNPTPAENDYFGWSVGAVGNYVLVGTPRDDTDRKDAGAAYLIFAGQEPVTLVSGIDGYYSLPDLDPGRYVVREILASGYYPTQPGGDGTHTVTITAGGFVTGLNFGNVVNTRPLAGDDAYVVDEDHPLVIQAPGLLRNDSDADGQPLSAVLKSQPSHGSLTLSADGSFQYVPQADYNGTDQFRYAAHDGYGESDWATVTITINQVWDGSVSGTVFEDLDADGLRDADESGLAGWTVELTPLGSPGTVLTTYLDPTPAQLGNFGWAVATVGDNLLVGSPSERVGFVDAGAAYLFDGASGALLRAFFNPTPVQGDDFGFAVAALGDNLLVGAPGDDAGATDAGAAYLFDATNGALLQTFLNPRPNAGDQFGHSVAAVGGYVLVGAPRDDTSAQDAGAAYLFDPATGELLWEFQSPAPVYQGFFGWSVAAVEGHALVGAPGDSRLALGAGAVFMFDTATGNLLETFQKPLPDDHDQFGYSIAAGNGRVLVGAIGDDTRSGNTGAAYLFDAATGNLLQPFFNPDADWGDQFGAGVALVGENVLIGTPRDQTAAGFRKGIAYLFHGPTGRLLSTVQNPSPQTTSHFGFSVAALGNDLVIGSLPNNSGAVFLIRGERDPLTAVTGADGNYEFTGVLPGVYTLAQVLPPTYRQTVPAGEGATYTISLLAEERMAGRDFGSWQPPAIVARRVFYNDSAWDGNNPAADAADLQAVATDKRALLPGETATFANYTSYGRGINGIILDLAGLADAEHLNAAADFEFKFGNDDHPDGWSTVPAMPTLHVWPGEGDGRSDRVTLIWEDNAIPTGNWLQVRVKATQNTGLTQDDVFYFGNASGDANGNGAADEADMRAIRDAVSRTATVEDPLDIDRDGVVAYADVYATYVRIGEYPQLNMIAAPSVVATDDAAATDEDTARPINVLGNDRDVDGNPLSVAAADAATSLGASITVNPDGTLTYDPRDSATLQALAAGQTMEDTFSYTISDVHAGIDTATVTVTVSGADDPPGAPPLGQTSGAGPSPAPPSPMSDEPLEPLAAARQPVDLVTANGHQARRLLRSSPVNAGAAPLAMNLDLGPHMVGINRASAHDAVMQQAAGGDSDGLEPWLARWDWIWWYDFEQMRMKNRSSKKDNNTVAKAADEFLAGRWP